MKACQAKDPSEEACKPQRVDAASKGGDINAEVSSKSATSTAVEKEATPKSNKTVPPTPPAARKSKQETNSKKKASQVATDDASKKNVKTSTKKSAAERKAATDSSAAVAQTTPAADANSVAAVNSRTDDAVSATQQAAVAQGSVQAAYSPPSTNVGTDRTAARGHTHDEDSIFGHIKQAAEDLIADPHEEAPQPAAVEQKQYMPAAHADHLTPPPPPRDVEGEVYAEDHPDSEKWFYRDPQGEIQGPFLTAEMSDWFTAGYFTMTLLVKRGKDDYFCPLGDLIKNWARIPFQPGPQPPALKVTASS